MLKCFHLVLTTVIDRRERRRDRQEEGRWKEAMRPQWRERVEE